MILLQHFLKLSRNRVWPILPPVPCGEKSYYLNYRLIPPLAAMSLRMPVLQGIAMLVSYMKCQYRVDSLDQDSAHKASKPPLPPFSSLPGIISTYSTAQNCSRTHPLQQQKCKSHSTTATTITRLIVSTFLTRRPTRRVKFWPGYLRLNPRDDTRKFEAVGWTKWEIGSCKLRSIGTGLVVSMEVNLMAQPCFATEVRGLARPTLGKRRRSRRERYC